MAAVAPPRSRTGPRAAGAGSHARSV